MLLDRFDPEAALELIAREGVTVAVGVPTHMIKIMNSPSLGRFDLSSLRLFYHAGAPLAPEAAAEFARKCGCRLMEAYGALDGGTPVHTLYDDPPNANNDEVARGLMDQFGNKKPAYDAYKNG